ncbi:MAG TPA: hypothetical protein VF384_01910 [Planctomycetota bacterium]
MTTLKAKRVVVVCFLEAAKTTLEHLGALRLALSQDGTPGPPDLARTYGEVRRLRDYLHRCSSTHQDPVELDMAEDDKRLLVACCRRSVEVIDHSLSGARPMTDSELQWLEKKRQVVADWAVQLASDPLLELPLNQLTASQTGASRALYARLQLKLRTEKMQRLDAAENQDPASVHFGAEPNRMAPSGSSVETRLLDYKKTERVPAPPPRLIDSSKLQDERLRAVVDADLASYERCVEACDYRLAEALLASVLEAAVLDHVLPQRNELGLTGPPETWSPHALLRRIMGGQGSQADRVMAARLFSARSRLRPAVQMVTPTNATAQSFQAMRDFVQRAMRHLAAGEPS